MLSRAMLVSAILLSCAGLGASQPVSCQEDNQCREGSFCETSVYLCHECLRCQDFQREPLSSPTPCIKSFQHCGPCLKGFVEDHRGDINCVLPTGSESASNYSIALWITSGVVIVILLVAAAYCAYRFMSKKSFNKFAVDTYIDAPLPRANPTAPEPPPLYSPPMPPESEPQVDEDSFQPLIKPYQPPFPAYEAQKYQNVSVFNPPSYIRLNNGPQAPPDPYRDNHNNFEPSIHDDDTTPSTWGPGENSVYYNNNASPELNEAPTQPQPEPENNARDLSSALSIARNTELIQQPPIMTRLHVSPDVGEEPGGAEEPQYNAAGGARGSRPAFNFMNVQQFITLK